MSSEKFDDAARKRISERIHEILRPFGFAEADHGNYYAMGGWWFKSEIEEFVVQAGQDISFDSFSISIGSKLRRRPRAHMRGPWSLSHLRGFMDGGPDHYIFNAAEDQIRWMKNNISTLLDSSFLNSDELKRWAVKASRRHFGQDPR